jgi:hypothetical protein
VKHHVHRIQDQPANGQVQHYNAEDVALLQLLEHTQMQQGVVRVRADFALSASDLGPEGFGPLLLSSRAGVGTATGKHAPVGARRANSGMAPAAVTRRGKSPSGVSRKPHAARDPCRRPISSVRRRLSGSASITESPSPTAALRAHFLKERRVGLHSADPCRRMLAGRES